MYKNVASQKWTVFAFDLTDNTPLTGDAAQITANVRIDGVQNAVDDANPTELEDGYYEFDLTQAETNGDLLVMCPASSTADIQVIGVPGSVWTAPAASIDWTNGGRLDLILDAIAVDAARLTAVRAAVLTDWIDGGRLDLLIDAIKAVTDVIPDAGALTTIDTNTARLTAVRAAVLTDWINGGRLDLLLDAIKAVTDALTAVAAAKIALSAGTIVPGTVSHDNTAATTTVFYSDDITGAVADHYNGRIIIFTSGTLQNEATDISDYELDTGEGKFTVTALTSAPADNVTFIII